jgi:hypothetical protein
LSHMICPIVSLGMHIGGLGTYMFGVNVSICCWRVSKVLELFLSWANQKGSLHKKRFIGWCQQTSLVAKWMSLFKINC